MRRSDQRQRQVEPIHTATLVEQVGDRLVGAVMSGRIPRGSRIIEVDLAEDLGVSRIPLREAMGVLETQGVLVSEPRRGRRVAAFDEEQMREICEARLAIERVAVREAAKVYRSSPTGASRLDDILSELERATKSPTPDPQTINAGDVAIHTEIYRAAGNRYLQMIWRGLAKHVLISFSVDQTFHRMAPDDIYLQHKHLRDLLLFGSEADLDHEIVAHITSYGRGFTALATPDPRRGQQP